MKRNRFLTGVALLAVVNLIITICLAGYLLSGKGTDQYDTQYVIYIGTNDKDSYTQTIPTEEAISIVRTICLNHVDGFTVQLAEGAWRDENGIVTDEVTIICYLDGINAETAHSIADETIRALNQNTVLIEENRVVIEYYSGKE